MSAHKFELGEDVRFRVDRWRRKAALGLYKIAALLPMEGREYLYRVKSTVDGQERIVGEAELVSLITAEA